MTDPTGRAPAPPSRPRRFARIPPGRRRFLAGLAVTTGGLALAAQFGPDWGEGAPARPPAAPARPAPAIPRPVQYGPAEHAAWQTFRQRFVSPEGRVIDTGNANISHSEGQGWGLMGAQAGDDPQSFARILDWTTRALQRRPYDRLHAWRYRPADQNPVSDTNNATDGDFFIASALARAAARWNRPDYAALAAQLASAILGLVRQAGGRTLLLPGATGFEPAGGIIINPSYYAFALIDDLAALAPSPLWDLLRRDGLALILQGRFGAWGLPPDWLRVSQRDGALSIASGWPARFSFDAIRVPLHLAWSGLAAAPAVDAFQRYWLAPRPMAPAWVDLLTNEVAPYPASDGMCAVAALTMPTNLGKTVRNSSVKGTSDYYSEGLMLLSTLAAREARTAA